MSVYYRASDETATVNDANTGAGTQFNAPVTESVTAQDTVAAVYSIGGVVSESATAASFA